MEYQSGTNHRGRPQPTAPFRSPSVIQELRMTCTLLTATPIAHILDAIRAASKLEGTVRSAVQALRTGGWITFDPEFRTMRRVKHEMPEMDDILLFGDRLLVLHFLRYRRLQLEHQGHKGMRKTLNWLHTKVWWPGMCQSVETHVATCIACARC